MENIPTPEQQANPNQAQATKISRRRIPKVTADQIGAFPGANPAAAKKPEPGFLYTIVFKMLVSGTFGTASEATLVYEFAHQLDTQAKAKGVGEVISVGVAEGIADVVLKLDAADVKGNHGTPAANAFAQLKDFVGTSALLKAGASYKAKVNGTTIVEGRF